MCSAVHRLAARVLRGVAMRAIKRAIARAPGVRVVVESGPRVAWRHAKRRNARRLVAPETWRRLEDRGVWNFLYPNAATYNPNSWPWPVTVLPSRNAKRVIDLDDDGGSAP